MDMRGIDMNTYSRIEDILQFRGIIKQVYKNIRTLIRNNPTVRATLNLETKDPGIYTPDVAMGIIDNMIQYCDINGYTTRRLHILVSELNNVELMLKDILQYFHYFIRPDFRQKPDIEVATETYKEIADGRTVEELREIVGKTHRIDFESLGTSRIELTPDIEYEERIDGLDDEDEEEPEEEQ